MKLSVVIPAYNEKDTILQVVEAIVSVPLKKEIIIVDDGSTDGTRELMRRYENTEGFKLIFHDANRGKGCAIRTGIGASDGDALIIQDADLEYRPADYLPLLKALQDTGANVVFGSRFLNKTKVTAAWHRAVNFFLTWVTNLLYGSRLTDMETCYKLFRIGFLRELPLRSDGFEIEAELTARVLRSGERIVEVPVSYKGRSYHEGKKIGWQDGLKTLAVLFYYRLKLPFTSHKAAVEARRHSE